MNRFCLPQRLDLPAAEQLLAALLSRRGAALVIDAGEVTHLGAACLQVLVAASADWRAAVTPLTYPARSEAFDAALAVFGLTPDDLQGGNLTTGEVTENAAWV